MKTRKTQSRHSLHADVRLWRGDLVSHKNRGRGVFENYAADSESCFVRFDDTGESDKVTSSMVRKLKEPNIYSTK